MDDPVRLAIIIGSTREGRFGDVVGSWFAERARAREDLDVDVIDLADLDLPSVLRRDPGPEVRAYAQRIDRADAVVIVTPEYNHGYPASLKQAVDLLHREWHAKPVGFVSYGGMAGGHRAVEQLRQVFAEVHAITVRDTVSFHNAWDRFDEHGDPVDPEGVDVAAKILLDQIVWWAPMLRDARAQRPYAA